MVPFAGLDNAGGDVSVVEEIKNSSFVPAEGVSYNTADR